MARKKLSRPEKVLSRSIGIRFTAAEYSKLEKLSAESNQSIGEIVRRIINNKRIRCFYRDISMNGPMEELSLIRMELKSIGININQVTHHFHGTNDPNRKSIYAFKAFKEHTLIETKVDRLLDIVSEIGLKWLRK